MRIAGTALGALVFGGLLLVGTAGARPPGDAPAQQQPGGGRGRGAAGPPPSPRGWAPVDLTGTWVSVVTEDWMWRMRTPAKGDVTSVPVNAEGRRIAEQWDPSMDGRCEAYGVGGLMRMPGRIRISWENDTTLKIETEAGMQTRRLHFGSVPPPPQPTLQGHSIAEWVVGGAALDAFLQRGVGSGAPRWGQLRVVTTNVRPGWLRRNGVPYSANATITEHFIRISPPGAGEWLIVSTIVTDPTYLTEPFMTSSNFKKEPDDSKWKPVPCRES
jgi:hypothetical protein